MPLTTNSFGPKSALCFVEQTIEDYVPGEYICLFNKTQTPHAPYGTSFHSEGRVCISRVSRTKTRAVTTYSVVFTKSTILKGTISKNAIAGSEKFYQDFERFVKGSLHLPMDVANEKSGHRQVRSSGSTTNQGVVKDSTTVSSSSTYTSLSASSIGDDSERDWSVFFSWSTITWIGVLVLMTLQSIVLVKLVTVLDKVASRMDSGHTGL